MPCFIFCNGPSCLFSRKLIFHVAPQAEADLTIGNPTSEMPSRNWCALHPLPPFGERGLGSIVWVHSIWVDILLYPHLLKHSPSPISSLFGQLPAPGLQATSSSITVHTCQCPGLSWLSAQFRIFSASEKLPPGFALKATTLFTRLISFMYLVLKFIQIFLYFKMFCFFLVVFPYHPITFSYWGRLFKSVTTQSYLKFYMSHVGKFV